jgi:SUMO ligase MMS21 Smc5/6 complex component
MLEIKQYSRPCNITLNNDLESLNSHPCNITLNNDLESLSWELTKRPTKFHCSANQQNQHSH